MEQETRVCDNPMERGPEGGQAEAGTPDGSSRGPEQVCGGG